MAEPSKTTNSPDAVVPRASTPQDGMGTPHERELPVSGSEADRPTHRVPAPELGSESEATSNGNASERANADAGAEALTEDQVKLALRRVKDPELNLNILDLGLVYAIRVDGNAVSVDMTLTSPGCPSGPEIMTDAERHLKAIPGVGDVAVNLVWSPFWSPERIEPRVRAYLGF
jgi:metal-sulfur cluster biosynthetic enzyme